MVVGPLGHRHWLGGGGMLGRKYNASALNGQGDLGSKRLGWGAEVTLSNIAAEGGKWSELIL